jgi:hypothetical protein
VGQSKVGAWVKSASARTPSVHLVLSQLMSLRSLVCSALDFFISGDTADVDFNIKMIQLMEDIWINVFWSSVSGLVLSHLLRAKVTLKQKRVNCSVKHCPSPRDCSAGICNGMQFNAFVSSLLNKF